MCSRIAVLALGSILAAAAAPAAAQMKLRIPAAPSEFRAVTGPSNVSIFWSDNAVDEQGYRLQRERLEGSSWVEGWGVTLAPDAESYVDAPPPGTYRYKIRAYNKRGFSSWVGPVSAQWAPDPLDPPTGLSVLDGGAGNAVLRWTDNTSNELGFEVERNPALPGGAARTAADATTWADPCGAGEFSYRVRAWNEDGASEWTGWVGVTVVLGTQAGWTRFTPSPDTRIVYVSNSLGDDSNSGLSESAPKRTIAAGRALLRNGYPDWLLFRRGDTWTDETFNVWTLSGRSATEPLLVSAYGESAARPLFKTGAATAWNTPYGPGENYELRFIAIVGLEFWAHAYDGTTQATGIRWVMPGSDLLVEDCYIHGYNDNLTIQGEQNNAGIGLRNFSLRRNVIADAYSDGAGHSQGIFMSGVYGALIEENVFDHNGWSEVVPGAVATVFNRNLYLSRSNRDVITRGNISARSASEGLQQRSGGLCEDNLFLQNSAGVLFGQFQSAWPEEATSGVVRNNVVLDARDIHTSPRGHGIWLQRVDGVEVYGNIIAHHLSGTGNTFGVYADYEYLNISIHDNVIYKWTRPTDGLGVGIGFAGTPVGAVVVLSNTVIQDRNGVLVSQGISGPGFTYAGNRYYATTNSPNWFKRLSNNCSFTQWTTLSGETGASTDTRLWVDAERTISTYMRSLGGEPTLEAFLREARRQSKSNWRPQFTASAVNGYVRAGFQEQ